MPAPRCCRECVSSRTPAHPIRILNIIHLVLVNAERGSGGNHRTAISAVAAIARLTEARLRIMNDIHYEPRSRGRHQGGKRGRMSTGPAGSSGEKHISSSVLKSKQTKI